MASSDAGEAEYESDPEEVNRSLAVRRREASDDDDDADGKVKNRRAEIDSDLSDEQNDSMKYDNDQSREETYEEEEDDDGDGIDNDKRSSVIKAAGDIDGDEEKEKRQSSVPTAGAFYMHDDRFQEMSVGQNRRMRSGRKPWGSEERKWGHDKFEEMNTQGKHYDSTSRGRSRSRGRGRGQEREYTRGSSSNALPNNGQQIYLPKAVKQGKGPRKFETSQRIGNQVHSEQSKQSQNFRRSPTSPAKTGNVGAHVKKNVAASNLNSSSPPFYPSVPSSNLVHGIQGGIERLHVNESATPSGKKYKNTKSGYAPVWTAKTLQSTSQGRGAPAAGNIFYSQSHSQGDSVSSPMDLNGNSKGTGQSCTIPSNQGFDHDQHSAAIRSLASPPHKTSSSRNRYPPDEIEIAKGKGTVKPSGSGPLMYSGSQMMGRGESLSSGDNSNIPTFLPVMQFGGQHGGVPTFGMAYPGYVESEHGVRNPEMTWMPVLTGPGALGASYNSPYAANQAYNPGLPVSLPSSAGTSSKENSTKNLNDLEKPTESHEVKEIGVSGRQNNNQNKQPRRYSEMSFTK